LGKMDQLLASLLCLLTYLLTYLLAYLLTTYLLACLGERHREIRNFRFFHGLWGELCYFGAFFGGARNIGKLKDAQRRQNKGHISSRYGKFRDVQKGSRRAPPPKRGGGGGEGLQGVRNFFFHKN